nr:retrovirus-related Pol polyprotein from transposon TNT 1-94 [Tanacetum cinerariifolium]
MGTFRETLDEGEEGAFHLGPERPRVYSDLSLEEKERYNADIRVTNIMFQGLPKDIYTLINHYTDANDIWDNVKMLLEGSELTKEDQESQLYDDFEHFRQNKGENIHDYYGRFETAVKLNRGLRDSNYDQLYAYLKQHEVHANQNKMMLDQFTQHTIDPLALMSNVSHQQCYSQSSTTPPSTHVQPYFADHTQLDSELSLTDHLNENLTNTLALLTQSYKTYLPQTNNQLRTPSNIRNQATVQDGMENGVVLDEKQLLFIAGGQDTVVDADVDEPSVQDLALNVDNVFQVDECDAFDSDFDEAPTAQTMFMANISSIDPVYDKAGPSYDSDVLSETAQCVSIKAHTKVGDASLTAKLVKYKEQVELYERRAKFKLTEQEQKIEENLRIVITDRNLKEENLKKELHSVKLQLNSTINHNNSMVEEVASLKKDFQQKENNYLKEFLDMKALKEKFKDKLFKQDQSLQTVQMLCKPKLYYDEQRKVAIGYKIPLYLTPCKRITPMGLTEGERGFEQTKKCYLTEVNSFFKTIKEHFEGIQKALTKEIKEMKGVFEELKAEVDQNFMNRKCDEIEQKNLLIANDNLVVDCLSKEVFLIATNSALTCYILPRTQCCVLVLHFVSCDLALHFGSAFCLIEDPIAFYQGEALPNSNLHCVLCQLQVAFGLKTREPDLSVPVPESFHEQTDEEQTQNDIKRMDADDQAIQTILLGLPGDEKKAKLFNEWEKFTSIDGESIKTYYHRFMQLMNDLKRNKHFPENIASNLKFLNNLEPKWKIHITIVRQTKNLHEADFTQIYDFLKMNHDENFMQPPMTSLEDTNDPTEAMNVALILFAKAFQLTAPTNNNQRTLSNPRNHQIAQPNGGKQNGLVVVPRIANQNGTGNVVTARAEGTVNRNQARCYSCRGLGHIARNCTARPRRRDAAYLQTQLLIAQKEEAGIQLQAKEFDFMAVAGDLDKIEEVNANGILMANLQHASTSGTQLDKALVYDIVGSAENDNHVTYVALSMVQSGGTLETNSAPNEDLRDHQETIYLNLFDQVTQEELFLSNVSNMVTVSKTISIPNEDLLDDTTPSVARKFLNEVKSSLVTLQRVVKQRMSLEVHNWSSSAHKEQKSLELEIERLLKASVSHDIISIVQNGFVDVPSDLQTELDCTKEKLELCITKKEKEYAVLWNNWYTKCEECKYDKISYDKAYNDMQQKVKRLQAQLRDLKGKSSDTPSASNTLDPLNQKLESKIIELEFQVVNYEPKSRVFENTSESMKNTSRTSVTPHVDKPKLSAVTPHSKKLHASMPSYSVPQPREFNIVKHRNVIALRMFKINPSQTSRENVSSNTVTASSTGLVHTARTRRPQPKGNTRNARVQTASKSSEVKKNVTVKEHRRTLLISKNQKTMSSECNIIKLAIQNDISETFCGTCKQCLVTANHDACLLSSLNALNARANNLCVNVPLSVNQKRHRTQVVQICLWCIDSGCSKHMTRNIKLLINFVWKFLGTVRFGNNHIAAILGYGDLKWGNITITKVYFIEGLGHNLFLVGQFCDANLEVAFRRNTCFIKDLDGVDLLKGNRYTNLYTINLYDMASASPICLLARATLTKLWLWHQRLSHLNFNTINDLAKNDLDSGLLKFKYAKEHLCPSCEQGKSKRTSHPPKLVLNSKQRLHLLHMCNTPILVHIAAKANLGYYFIA